MLNIHVSLTAQHLSRIKKWKYAQALPLVSYSGSVVSELCMEGKAENTDICVGASREAAMGSFE